MAGEIKHVWHGTVLTITSDSGTSSMDLKGETGDDGIRGPQGPAGIIIGEDGQIDWNGYATEQWVQDMIDTIDVDLTGIATENYVNAAVADVQATCDQHARKFVAEAQIPGADVNLDDYALKTDVKTMIDEALGVIENGSY